MPQFSANLRYMFQELPLYERFDAAGGAGFRAVEYPFPYSEKPADIKRALDANDLQMTLISMPPGDWKAGEHGLAGIPGREKDFQTSVEDAIYYATSFNCRNVHIMSGVLPFGVPRESALSVLAENLSFAAEAFENAGIRALIKPLNEKDMPGYLISRNLQARAIMAVVNSSNLQMLYNFYHSAMAGEDIEESIRSNLDVICHMQVAGVPGRAEPDTGHINYNPIFELLDTVGYSGWVGCEYTPSQRTLDGLKWASLYGIGSPFQAI